MIVGNLLWTVLNIFQPMINLLNNGLLLSTIGAAFGALAGYAIFEWRKRRRIKKEIKRAQEGDHIRTYKCINPLNNGAAIEANQEPEKGELVFRSLKVVEDEEAEDGSLVVCYDDISKDHLGHVINGPFTSDFSKPGRYKVVYRIKGVNIAKREDVTYNDFSILELQIFQTSLQYIGVKGHIVWKTIGIPICSSYVRYSHLCIEGWQDYALEFYSDATRVWEYTVFVFDGVSRDKYNNIQKLKEGYKILIDNIKVYKIYDEIQIVLL